MLVDPTGEIAVTRAPSSTPVRALSVTVAAWPTLILLTSDSLKGTVTVIVCVLTISANGELDAPDVDEDVDEVDPAAPSPPAVVPAAPPAVPIALCVELVPSLLVATLAVEPAGAKASRRRKLSFRDYVAIFIAIANLILLVAMIVAKIDS